MLEIPILKEIRAYETKLVGPLSLRGLICMLVAAAGAYGSYFIQTKLIGLSQPVGPLILIAAMPGVSFLIFKPYGLPLEKYLKSSFIDAFVAPKQRPYKQEICYKTFAEGMMNEPTFFDDEEETEEPVKNGKKSKNKKLPEELTAYK